jgi:hypothetical protein
MDNEGRCRTVWTGKRRQCHDDGPWVTLTKNGNGTVTVTGQNHNFYSKLNLFGLSFKSMIIYS